MERQQVVLDFTLAYFQKQFENIGVVDTSHMVFPTVDKNTISLNKLSVIRFMYVLWEGVGIVYGDIPSFADVLPDISRYYDVHYPYMDLHTGSVRVVHSIDDFGYFANEIADIVFREKEVLWPSSSTSLQEFEQYVKGKRSNLPIAPAVNSISLPIGTEHVQAAEHTKYWTTKLDVAAIRQYRTT